MLLFLPCRRCIFSCLVPACLALGALCALPVLADRPAGSAALAVQTAQKIVLQNVVPSDVVKQMHWDQPGALPSGVTQISALPAQNALSVTATPAGLAQVREIVKLLDIAPHQVRVKFLLAFVSEAALKAALGTDQSVTGIPAARFLQALTKQQSIAASTTITTTNSVSASESCFYGPKAPLTFAVTPHANGDNSVTLALDAVLPEDAGKREVHTLRTVQSGGTLAVVMPPARASTDKQFVLLFVVPAVLK